MKKLLILLAALAILVPASNVFSQVVVEPTYRFQDTIYRSADDALNNCMLEAPEPANPCIELTCVLEEGKAGQFVAHFKKSQRADCDIIIDPGR